MATCKKKKKKNPLVSFFNLLAENRQTDRQTWNSSDKLAWENAGTLFFESLGVTNIGAEEDTPW